MKATHQLFESDKAVISRRCVHLDLKGTPPTPERLIKLLRVFSAARYNSVLVEWEDSFPWTVDKRFRSETAYSPAIIKGFVKTADDLGMEIIPLVQCLGHMETPLRLPEYAGLREVDYDESVLNPLARGARGLIEKMMDDVLTLMPNVKRFHLGGDEAWVFGTHPDTKKYISKHGRDGLYLHHVEPLLDKLIKREIRPMLWHDMMPDWGSPALRRLGRKADLVVWGYSGHPYAMMKHCNKEMMARFSKHNISLWGATIYKTGSMDADLPDIPKSEANALGWAEVAVRHGFVGVIATAWSRYWTNSCQKQPIDGALDAAFNVGVILHDGKSPKGGIEACRHEIKRIGEGRAFGRVRGSLEKLSAARDSGWVNIRRLRTLIATLTQDSRRSPSWNMVKYIQYIRHDLRCAESASNALRKALKGLMEPVWVERYIGERLEPLRDELALLEPRVLQFSPEVYAALEKGSPPE